jgi:hypothetical protein
MTAQEPIEGFVMGSVRNMAKFVQEHIVDLAPGGFDQFKIQSDPVGSAGITSPAPDQSPNAELGQIALREAI